MLINQRRAYVILYYTEEPHQKSTVKLFLVSLFFNNAFYLELFKKQYGLIFQNNLGR